MHMLLLDKMSTMINCSAYIISDQQVEHRLESIPQALLDYGSYLKDLYKGRKGMRLKWPNVFMKDFINLFFVERASRQHRKVTKQMVCGEIDKVTKTRVSLQLIDLAPVSEWSDVKLHLSAGSTRIRENHVFVGGESTVGTR